MLDLSTAQEQFHDLVAAYASTWQAWRGYTLIYGEDGARAQEIRTLLAERHQRIDQSGAVSSP